MRRLLVLAALLVALPASAVTIDWVYVGDAGNAPDTATNCFAANCGSVAYDYYISKYEVTNAQYAEFLNAVADTDTNGLYNTSMGELVIGDPNTYALGGITRSGSSGSYTYAVKGGQENNPVVFVSWYDTLRFANWLNNGKPTGPQGPTTTEDGAYTFSGTTTVGPRNAGARKFLPTQNEWYKAAYYDAELGIYFDYPTGSNTAPTSQAPPGGNNSANFYDSVTGYALTGSTTFDNAVNYLTDVGAYASSDSPYGTFDQGGNVFEWNETASPTNPPYRGYRGGSWSDYAVPPVALSASQPVFAPPTGENAVVGFRVASLVPEPRTGLLVMTGLLGMAARRRRRA